MHHFFSDCFPVSIFPFLNSVYFTPRARPHALIRMRVLAYAFECLRMRVIRLMCARTQPCALPDEPEGVVSAIGGNKETLRRRDFQRENPSSSIEQNGWRIASTACSSVAPEHLLFVFRSPNSEQR